MAIFDIILLIILSGFIFYGLFFGLIKTLGALFAIVIGVWTAFHYYLVVYGWTKDLFFNYGLAGKIIIFIAIFSLVNRLVSFIFALLNSAFDILSIIPFLKTINKLAGAILGFLLGGLILGLVLAIVSHYTSDISWLGWIGNILTQSKVAPFLLRFVNALALLPPDLLPKLKSIF